MEAVISFLEAGDARFTNLGRTSSILLLDGKIVGACEGDWSPVHRQEQYRRLLTRAEELGKDIFCERVS